MGSALNRVVPFLIALVLSAGLFLPMPLYARRAVTISEIVNDADSTENDAAFTSTDAPSFATTSVSVCVVGNSDAAPGGGDTTPTLTQTGYTWTRIDGPRDFGTDASPGFSLSIFRAVGTGATGAALTADFGADAQTSILINCFEVAGTDTGGTNGANAIVQFKAGVTDAADPFTITFDGALTDGNGAIMWAGCSGAATFNVTEPNWSAVGTEFVISAPASEWKAQHHNDNNASDHTALSWDFGGNEECGGYIVELSVAGGAAAPVCQGALLGLGCLFMEPR